MIGILVRPISQPPKPGAARNRGARAPRWCLIAPVNELELLAYLRETSDPSAWAVYADVLQGRDEVRGELVALALAGQTEAELRLRTEHRAELGPVRFWEALDRGQLVARWAFGHVVELGVRDANFLGAAVTSPACVALNTLRVQLPVDAAATLERLSSLRLGARVLSLSRPVPGQGFDPAAVLDGSGLVDVELEGLDALGDVTATRLESLRVSFSAWDGRDPRLGELDAPSLHTLVLRALETTPPLTRWFRHRCAAPGLRSLTVESMLTSQLIEAIVDAPFAKTLEALSLLLVDDASAHALLTHRARLPKLKQLSAHSFRTSQAVEARVREVFS